jgi:hypothetical protein
MASMTVDWIVAHHVGTILAALPVMATSHYSADAPRSVRQRFAVAMAAVAPICFAAIPFLP